MADPRFIVPYHDPYDYPIDYDNLNYMSTQPDLSLATLSPSNVTNYQDHQQVQKIESSKVDPSSMNDNIGIESEEPLDDPTVWDIFLAHNNNKNGGNSNEAVQSQTVHGGHAFGGSGNSNEAGPSQPVHEGHGFGGSFEDDLRLEGVTLEGGKPLPAWPPPPVPFGCTCCNLLRELIHTDGNFTTKLEIHGRLGLICHAILQSWDHVSVGISNPQHHMFDFCKKSTEDVKEFLKQYCIDRKNAGLIMLQDPHSVYYQALMVGIDSQENIQDDDFADPTPTNSAECPFEPAEYKVERMHRSHLALQRERAGRLTTKDFENYFHLPIEEAARRLNLCPTVVKKICRRNGMARWPYRKIRSLQRQISNHGANLNSENAQEKANAEAEIARLEQQIVSLRTGN